MRRPIAISAHLALRPSRVQDAPPARPPRPDGPLVWVHSSDPSRLLVARAIQRLLTEEGDEIAQLITTDLPSERDDPLLQLTPADTLPAAQDFLQHWRPDALIWLDGPLVPALLTATSDAGIRSIVLDVSGNAPQIQGRSRVPGLARATLGLFHHGLSADAAGLDRLRRAGLPENRIFQTGPFDLPAAVPPCDEDARTDLANILASRPICCAAAIPEAEIAPLLQAYKGASHRRHRLLMILAVQDLSAARKILASSALTFADYDLGEDPRDSTQVLLADVSELGLWYRLAPLTYIGGSLTSAPQVDPFEPAALGSAILHGLRTERYARQFDQLADASAGRMVRDPVELGKVIEELLSPDRAARMAHAAWDVTSRGSETGALIRRMVQDALETAGR